MPFSNPDPLKYTGSADASDGTKAPSGVDTDAATAWLEQQPWYKQTLASWGNPKTLTLGQRGYLARTAIAQGMDPSFGISTDGKVEDWTTNNPMFWSGVAGMGGGLTLGATGASPLAGGGDDLVSSGEATVSGTSPLTTAEAGSSLTGNVASAGGGTIGKLFGGNTLDSMFGAAAKGIGGAATAAGNNRLDQEKLGLEAAGTELAQRKAAAQDTAREAYATSGGHTPRWASGPQEAGTLQMLANQGKTRLLTPLSTITPSNVQQATGTQKGTLETLGDWLSPALSIASKIPW